MASHTLQVLQEHPEQRQVQLGNLCLLVLKAGMEKNLSKVSKGGKKGEVLSQNM